MESDSANEMIKLIEDYMKDPDEIGWDPPMRKPKSLMQLRLAIRNNPLKVKSRIFQDPIPSQ